MLDFRSYTFQANTVTPDGGDGVLEILVTVRGGVDGALLKVHRDSSIPEGIT
jgi:hypothetical protein